MTVLDIDRRGGNVESGVLLSRYWRSYGRDIPWCNIDGVDEIFRDAISLVEYREGNILRARLPLKYSAMQYSSWKVDEIFRGAISFVQYYRNIANVMDEIFRGVISIISYQCNISRCNIDNAMLLLKYCTVQYPSWKVIDEIFRGVIFLAP